MQQAITWASVDLDLCHQMASRGLNELMQDCSISIANALEIVFHQAIDIRHIHTSELILGLLPANERRRYKVTPSHIGWVQT